jgi:endo-1,4-beta-xylanase
MIHRPVLVWLSIAALILPGACDSGESNEHDSPPETNPDPLTGPLRDLAEPQGVQIGAAADAGLLLNNEQYRTVLGREFNAVTPENAMKWNPVRPSRDEFDFEAPDSLVAFAAENDMDVRGHTLVWHSQLPDWIENYHGQEDTLRTILENHIKTVVNHYEEEYPGQVSRWDVVNEVIEGTQLRNSIWLETIGEEYIALAFEWANEANPDAELYYNDYGIAGGGSKADAVYDLVSGLVNDGVPIDGVGFQSHLNTENPAPSDEDLVNNMERYQDLGLDVAITEIDVRIPLGSDGEPSDDQLSTQADYYERFLNTCLFVDNCTEFRIWGFTDAESWIPEHFDGYGAALIFDEQYNKKPAYNRILKVLDENQDE